MYRVHAHGVGDLAAGAGAWWPAQPSREGGSGARQHDQRKQSMHAQRNHRNDNEQENKKRIYRKHAHYLSAPVSGWSLADVLSSGLTPAK